MKLKHGISNVAITSLFIVKREFIPGWKIVNYAPFSHIYNMTPATINKLIGYGVLFFIIGIIASIWFRPFEGLAIIGVLVAFTGVLFFFKKSRIQKSSRQKRKTQNR